MTLKIKHVTALVLGALTIPSICGADVPLQYQIQEIITGLTNPHPKAINNDGEVVGIGKGNDGNADSFIYHNGSTTLLTQGMVDGVSAAPGTIPVFQLSDINNRGDIVGSFHCVGNPCTGTVGIFLVKVSNNNYRNIQMGRTNLLPRSSEGLNDSGVVVGSANDGINSGVGNAFMFKWDGADGGEINYIRSDYSSGASDVNANNIPVGVRKKSITAPFDGFINSTILSSAIIRGINDNNIAVGTKNITPANNRAIGKNSEQHPEWWTLCGNSDAFDINNSNITVGYSFDCSGIKKATLFTGQDIPVDLNNRIDDSSGWTLNQATAINDNGQIVGFGTKDGEQRAFLLSPADYQYGTAIKPLSPLTNVHSSDWTSTFSWKRKPEATRYRFALIDRFTNKTLIATTLSPAALGCSMEGSNCSYMPDIAIGSGEYLWQLRYEYSPNPQQAPVWTPYASKTYFAVDPEKMDISLIAPRGTQTSGTTTLQWNSAQNAKVYRVYVKNITTGKQTLLTNLTPSAAGCSVYRNVCSKQVPNILPAGKYLWSARVKTALGWKPFAPRLHFTVPAQQ